MWPCLGLLTFPTQETRNSTSCSMLPGRINDGSNMKENKLWAEAASWISDKLQKNINYLFV